MTIVGAIIGSLVCGASGYFAGYMKGASKWFDEIENREATTILNNVTARTTVVALGANMNIFLGCLISVFRHMNGADPKLVAKRSVADRFWNYVEKYQ